LNIVDLRHVLNRHHKHMTAVTWLLAQAWEHGGVCIAERQRTRSELAPQDAAEGARLPRVLFDHASAD